jgi:hypothetical protein
VTEPRPPLNLELPAVELDETFLRGGIEQLQQGFRQLQQQTILQKNELAKIGQQLLIIQTRVQTLSHLRKQRRQQALHQQQELQLQQHLASLQQQMQFGQSLQEITTALAKIQAMPDLPKLVMREVVPMPRLFSRPEAAPPPPAATAPTFFERLCAGLNAFATALESQIATINTDQACTPVPVVQPEMLSMFGFMQSASPFSMGFVCI